MINLVSSYFIEFLDSRFFGAFLHAGLSGYIYIGCYEDGSGPYLNRQLMFPLSLNLTGLSVFKCAWAAWDRGYPVFSLRGNGACFMGSPADVAKVKAASQNTTDARCAIIPCDQGAAECPTHLNKVFLLEGMPGSTTHHRGTAIGVGVHSFPTFNIWKCGLAQHSQT
jgi:hypothetical protein